MVRISVAIPVTTSAEAVSAEAVSAEAVSAEAVSSAIPVALPVGSSGSSHYWAARAIEDINTTKAAALYREAIANGCSHSLYALGTMYAKYPPSSRLLGEPSLFVGRREIKKAAGAGYVPALYHMYWDYKKSVADHRLNTASQAIFDKAFQKSESYLREAKDCDPDGTALMFEIKRFTWGREFPAAGSQEYRVQWPEALSERYRMAIELAQDQAFVRIDRISAYLDNLNAHVDAVTQQEKPVNVMRLEERCRVYYMLGMACKSLGLTTEAQKNFKLAAGVTLLGERPPPAEHWLAIEELTRM